MSKLNKDIILKDLPTNRLNLHIYGKFESKPNRKMGHITIVNKDLKIGKKIANEVKETVIITSRK